MAALLHLRHRGRRLPSLVRLVPQPTAAHRPPSRLYAPMCLAAPSCHTAVLALLHHHLRLLTSCTTTITTFFHLPGRHRLTPSPLTAVRRPLTQAAKAEVRRGAYTHAVDMWQMRWLLYFFCTCSIALG